MKRGNYEEKNGRDKPVGKQGTVALGYDAPFRGYLNVQLSPEQKEAYVAWAESSSYWEALSAFTADGVNLSLKFEPKQQCFLASGTQRRADSVNAGLVVTARASEPAQALGRLLYTLTYLGYLERWEDKQPMTDPDRW